MAKALKDENDQPIKCSETIFDTRCFSYRCSKNASIMRGDKPYCGTHDPIRRAEKRKACDEAWKTARRERDADRAESKAKFVQRVFEAGQMIDGESRERAAEQLVEDILSAGFSWWRN